MHRSRGTRKDVSGLNVRIRRRPCSGWTWPQFGDSPKEAPRSTAELTEHLQRLGPKGAPDCCAGSAHSANMSCGSTSACTVGKSGLTSRPRTRACEGRAAAAPAGGLERAKQGMRQSSKLAGWTRAAREASAQLHHRVVERVRVRPVQQRQQRVEQGCSTTTSRYNKSNLACASARKNYRSNLTYALGSSTRASPSGTPPRAAQCAAIAPPRSCCICSPRA